MKLRRRIFLLGLALVLLLASGIAIVIWWPLPSVAEQKAPAIEKGMTWQECMELVGPPARQGQHSPDTGWATWQYPDDSFLGVVYSVREGEARVTGFGARPPDHDDPLANLQRTLLRLFPFLKT
jgi:hypothetical protein